MTAPQLRARLRRRIDRDGLRATARALGMSFSQLGKFMRGDLKEPPRALLEALGMRVVYMPVGR